MPKLTKKFSEVFEFFRGSQSTSSIASTQFTTKEVEEIREIFADSAKSYEEAYAEFKEKIKRKEEALSEEKKRQISLKDDPFVQAIDTAYGHLHSQKSDHHDDLAELREQVEQDEKKEQPEKEKPQPSEKNQDTQNQEIDLQFMRNMGVKQLFYGLLSEYERTSPSTKRTQKLFEELTTVLNTTIIDSDIDVDLACLQKMLTLLYQNKINEKLNDKSAEYKLIKALLTAFMFYDHLTEVKYAKLVNILLTMQMPDETKIPADESIVHDVFALRLVTLEVSLDGKNLIPEKSEERAACRDFFKDVAEKNVFKYALVDRQSSLLTAAQFFEKPSYDKEEFAAYQAFIENLAKAMAFYRKTPVEESDCIVSNLLSIGIEHLLKIDQGFAPYDPIAQPINSFLTFLSGVYKKSSLIPQAIFKSAIERLLLHQVSVYPQATNVDDEIWLHSQFNAIYQKYLELNKVEADQELFRKNFVNCTTKHLLIYSDEEYSAILEDLLKIISEKNYNYMRDQIDLLSMWLGRAGVLKIMTEFKEKEKNSTFIVSKLIEDFRNAEYTSCSPFLRQIAYLHPEVNSLWATPTWKEIKKMVEPLVK